MATSFLARILALVVLTSAQTYLTEACVVDNIPVQADFQLEKYMGKWYEIDWIPPYYDGPMDYWIDYVEVYKDIGNNLVQKQGMGRDTPADDECSDFAMNMTVESSAKWTSNKVFNTTLTVRVDYWIIATDYDNYAFVYGCTVRKPDGTCQNAHAWLWSRRKTISAAHRAIVDEKIASVCLDKSDFIPTPQQKDCAVTDGGDTVYSSSHVIKMAAVVLSYYGIMRVL